LVIFQKRVPELSELALMRFATRARQAAGLKGSVDILVTSSREMKALNRRFCGKDRATDVLSFPASAEGFVRNGAQRKNARKEFAGEIAISAEIAAQSARALGHSAAEEVKVLVLHGLLHLRGYDHERDDGQMSRREKQLRMRLGLPSGLIERSGVAGESVDSASGRRGELCLYDKLMKAPKLMKDLSRISRRIKTR
jgi:probable rRNA maturation factor